MEGGGRGESGARDEFFSEAQELVDGLGRDLLMLDDLLKNYRASPEEDRKRAKVFFDRGNTVAGMGNYEYAIEMYIQGLNIDWKMRYALGRVEHNDSSGGVCLSDHFLSGIDRAQDVGYVRKGDQFWLLL